VKILADFEAAQNGIRAVVRGETPIQPRDPYLLYDLAVILADCGLRPEEGYRLRFEEVKDGVLHIAYGKSKNARRVIPTTDRAKAILEWRRQNLEGEWVFPAYTTSGHAEQSTIARRHEQACEMAKIPYFVVYTFRHTRLTRWAATMDAFTLAYLAGHSDIATTRRYVHVQMETIQAAFEKAHRAETTHNSGHSAEKPLPAEIAERRLIH
jgi:integrase